MATPAAVLSILVDANTHSATTALSKFERQLKGVDKTSVSATTRTSTLGSASRKTGSYLASAAKYAAGAAAAYISIGEAKQAIETTQDLAKTTAGLNRNLGFTVKQASEWGAVAKSRDVDGKALTMSFTTLSRRLTDTATALKAGGSAAETAYAPFQRLGLSQQDVIKGSQDISAFMPKLANAFGDAAGGAERQASAQQLLGRGYQSILPLFADGAKGLKEQQMWADKYGATLSGKTLKGQMDLIQSERETKVAILGLQVSFTKFLTPALEVADEKFRRIAAIVGSDKLTPEEKFKKIGDIVGKWADKAYDAFVQILPKIISAAGEKAPKVAQAFAEGFMNASIWGKLALGSFLFAKAGGAQLAGVALGKLFGKGMGRGIAVGVALGLALLLPEFAKWVSAHRYEIRAKGVAIGNALANGVIDAVNAGIQHLVDTLTGDNPLANALRGIGVGIPNLSVSVPKIPPINWDPSWQHAPDQVKHVSESLKDLVKQIGKTNDSTDHLNRQASQSLQDFSKNLDTTASRGKSDLDRVNDAADKSGKSFADFAAHGKVSLDKAGDATDSFRGKSAKNFGLTGNSIHALDSATGSGLKNIGDNLNSILKGMKVGEVKFSIKQAARSGLNAINSVVGRQGGGMVPGSGSGDTVPLHIGGQLAAMVEPGEYVSVANRNATAALMQANAAVPRFADGGVVPAVSQAIKLVTGKFPGLSVTSTTGGGHAAGSYHYQGKAVDLANGDTGYMDKAAAWIKTAIGKYLLEGIHNPNLSISNGQTVSPSFWGASTWADHIDHIHLALDSLGRVMGAASKIKQQILGGPSGPLTDLGQSILDRARTAGDNFIAKHSPGVGDTGMGVTFYKGPLDKTFPSFSVTSGFGGQPQLSPDQVRGLATKAGLPGSTFEKIAHGESNYFPGVISTDGGYGLWQMTPRVQSAETVNAWHKIGSYFNPWRNALMAKYLYDRAPSKTPNTPGFPWFGTRYLQRGGIVPRLAKGGKPRGFHPHITGWHGHPHVPGTYHVTQQPNYATAFQGIQSFVLGDQLRKVLAAIDKQDEAIGIFDQIANANGDFTPAERFREWFMDSQLLAMLQQAASISRQGSARVEKDLPKATTPALKKGLRDLQGTFSSTLEDMVGLTGYGGRILDTVLAMAALKQSDTTTTGTDTGTTRDYSEMMALQLAQAQDTIRALQVGIAQAPVYAGAFAAGGSIPSGAWGIAGEAGPEVIHGPAQVVSASETRSLFGPSTVSLDVHVYDDRIEVHSNDKRIEKIEQTLSRVGRPGVFAGAGRL